MRIIKLIIYYAIASKLPNSWWPGGGFFNAFRVWCLKGVLSIGNGNKVQKGVYVGNGKGITIGNHCQINEAVRLDNVSIGDNVMIARETVILGKTHEASDVTIPMTNQGNRQVDKTVVENDVWLGLRSIVMPGLTIATGTIVGSASVVTKSTDAYSIYGGVPAKFIKKRV